MTSDFPKRLKAAEHVLAQEVQGELVLLNLVNEQYYGLDGTATSMWWEMTTSESVEEAYQRLLQNFEVAPEQLREDLGRLISELIERNLVEIAA